jgi:ring-1,2-phenylacetyl-CoA epoxidase subunit PaaB
VTEAEWPLYEVFIRGRQALAHVHVGSLHAPDDQMALRNARDVYTRRNEGVSIWVVRSDLVTAGGVDAEEPGRVHPHPTFPGRGPADRAGLGHPFQP